MKTDPATFFICYIFFIFFLRKLVWDQGERRWVETDEGTKRQVDNYQLTGGSTDQCRKDPELSGVIAWQLQE